jgi:SagB-type dehydrogenase family enzyme
LLLTAADYHDLTSYDRYKMSGHGLDWLNQPNTFKTYQGLTKFELEEDTEPYQGLLSELFRLNLTPVSKEIRFKDLSSVLKLSHCLTRKEKSGPSYFYFRNVASAGALYPFETYLVTFNVHDLEQGLYHHSVADQSIAQLRKGYFYDTVASVVHFECEDQLAVVFFLTSLFFRSSWKYRDRAFRYHLLDTGHLCENLALALKSEKLKFEISYDFDDSAINELLAIDSNKEACLAIVGVFSDEVSTNLESSFMQPPSIDLKKFSLCAPEEKRYPAINEIHSITSMKREGQKRDFIRLENFVSVNLGESVGLAPFRDTPELINYNQALLQRRSRRNFIRKPISSNIFSWLVGLFQKGNTSCHENISWRNFLSTGVLISDVEGIAPGFYLIEPHNGSLRLVLSGLLTEEMAHICLDQIWLSNCSCHFLFLADLPTLEAQHGPRSYRYAMLETGRLGQLLYLAAESIGFGCCGIGAFYDSEAREFLNLRSSVRLLYLVGLGPLTKAFV